MSHSRSRLKKLLAFAILYFGWGGSYLAARFTLRAIPPLLSSGTGFTVAGALLSAWSQKGRPWPTRKDWVWASALGAFMILGGMGGTIWSEQRIASGIAALVVSAEPIWMTLYEWVAEHRRPKAWTLMGLSLGLTGVVYLSYPKKTGGIDRLDLYVLLTGAMLWIVGALLSRKIKITKSEEQGTGLFMFAGGLQLLIVSACLGEWSHFHLSKLTGLVIGSWCYNTFFSSLIGFTVYIWLLKVVRVSVVSTYAFVNPVIALLLGWWLANEKLTWQTGLASGLLILGVMAITISQSLESGSQR